MFNSKSIETCVVLGLNSNTGLSIIRQLGKNNIKSIGYDSNKFALAKYSKYCTQFVKYTDIATDLLEKLIYTGRKLKSRIPVLVSSDALAIFMDNHREELEPYYFFHWQKNLKLEDLIRKDNMIKLAMEAGLDTPQTLFFDTKEQLIRIKEKINFPFILKPLYTKGKKGIIIKSARDLDTLELNKNYNGFIAQEIIEGPETDIKMIGSYSDRNGTMQFYACGMAERQLPRDFGCKTAVTSCYDLSIVRNTARFLRHIKYFGVADIEFKKSIRDGTYKFIEINPRMCGFNEFYAEKGLNLAYCGYLDLIGKLEFYKYEKKKLNVSWVSILEDLYTIIRYYKRKRLIIVWLKRLICADSYAVFMKQDLKPFIVNSISFVLKGVLALKRF